MAGSRSGQAQAFLRAWATAGYAVVAIGMIAIVLSGRATAETAPPQKPTPIRVSSQLPAWLAPGARLSVAGSAGANQPLVLRLNTRTAARTRSGPLGTFRITLRAPGPGRYRVTVGAAGRAVAVGQFQVRPVTVAAVGDITFGEQVGPAVSRYGGRYPWTEVAAVLRRADITVGNLETAVSTRGVAAAKEYTFRGPPEAVPPLASFAGFDVLTLANNHAADYGREALLDTLRYVRTAGIEPIGAGESAAAARRPALVEAGGLRIAFLGYSDVNPDGFNAAGAIPGTAQADTETIAADVRAARTRADAAVCFFHWGAELQPEPDARQHELASACLAAGAQVVLGAHPHVLGPVERPTERTLVAWTLGNFVFPSYRAPSNTAILEIDLAADGVTGHRLLPAHIDGFRPRLLDPRS